MRYFILACVALIFADKGYCQINCHQCRSIFGLNCLDPYNGPNMEGTYSGGCSNTDTHCYKFKTISRLYDSGFITGKARETNTMTRGCFQAMNGESTSELVCHQCNSLGDLDCLDEYVGPIMEDSYSDSCEDTDTHCYKYKIISRLYDSGFITGKPRETRTITRGCIRATGESDGCKYIQSAAGFQFQCICSKDNCNGARGTMAGFLIMVSAFVFTILLKRIMS